MANEYVSASALKKTLELEGESFADDDVELACTAASRAIDNLCGRRFWRDANATQVRYFTPSTGGHVWVDDLEVLTQLAVDDQDDGSFTEVWSVSDVALEPLNAAADGRPFTSIKVRRGRTSNYFPCRDGSVKVTGRFGWSAVPAEITQATGILAAKLVKRAREAPFGFTMLGADGVGVRLAQKDPEIMMLIGPFVRESHA